VAAKSAKALTATHISLSARGRAIDPMSTTATQTSQSRRSIPDRLRGSIGTHPNYVHPACPVVAVSAAVVGLPFFWSRHGNVIRRAGHLAR
jgi:hypothetical protein